jgi:NAD(P)-dependent dehydrogenase (short-subunit alcohol dehydrogenase family)
MEPFSVRGKTTVITGGGSGIGRAISEILAEHGAIVHILDLNIQHAEETRSAITANSGQAIAHECDISELSEVEAIISSIIRSDPVHILVNNAGIAHIGNLETTTENDMDRLFRINVKGYYNCMRACIPHMRARGQGVILNIASIAGLVGLKDRFGYSMTKGAVLAMTYSVAKDYLPHNIRCNSISPARVHTPFVDGFLQTNYPGRESEMLAALAHSQPIGRMANPREIASLALYLCSDAASFITGTNYMIDGGALTLSIQ